MSLRQRLQRAFASKSGNAAAVAALCLGTIASLLLAFYVAHWERQALRAELRQLAEDKTSVLAATLLKATEVLFSLRSLHAARGELLSSDFELFARDAVSRDPSLRAVQWLPRVAASEHEDYEARRRASGITDYRFKEIDASGKLKTAGVRHEYFPVYFNVPMAPNAEVDGVDLAFNPTRREALERAWDSGQVAASSPIPLVQAQGQPGFLMCLAVYQGNPDNALERRQALKGVVVAVFHAGHLIETAFQDLLDAGIGITVRDVKAGQQILFAREGAGMADAAAGNSWSWFAGDHSWNARHDVAGRDWLFAFQPNSRFLASRKPWQTLNALGIGLTLTVLLAAYLAAAARRTREINHANEALRNEVRIRQQAEQQLEQARDAANSANRAKSEFLAQMSHELRTPLNGILGYAQILHREAGLSREQREGLDTIRHCGEHLLSLINEILDLAKIEAGRMELDAHAFSLPELVSGIAAIFRERAADKGLHFSAVLDELPNWVRGDERKLRQVLINLLGNAVKFTECGEVVLRVAAAQETVHFAVQDSGPGIPPERLHELFQPFTQLRDAAQPKEGTGLGLAISRRLVKIMGGELTVASTPGEGACFQFELPLPEAHASDLSTARSEPAIVGYRAPLRRILIADDKAVNRAVLLGMLKPLGFDCREAVDGEDCLHQAAAMPPDLILMDIVMPRLDGLEAARRLRRAPETRNIPIVAMSASVFEEDKQHSLEVGCEGFIAKPVIANQLLETLARCLKLEWIYDTVKAETPLPPPGGDDLQIERLPEPIARALWEAARKGHGKGVLEQVKALETLGGPYINMAAHLRELARQFRFEDICRCVEPFLSDRERESAGGRRLMGNLVDWGV